MIDDIRTGFGVDVHIFGGDGPVRLGGVDIAHDVGLVGHSDADAAAHAITDALCGAAGLGDIGTHFPDTDAAWAGADSLVLLARIVADVTAAGWRIANVDVTIVCERPKIGPHRAAMQAALAAALGIESPRVNVKATTTETLGFTGRREGLAALAVATLVR